jgi:hypothetical protein
MAIALYFDVHVDSAIAGQLRLRQVDILTAQDDGTEQLRDDLLLDHASQLGRPLVIHDIRLHAMAENWQSRDRPFSGLIFGHLLQVSIGQCVRDLELIAKATDPVDWECAVIRLPL